jgi:hypothetical protein
MAQIEDGFTKQARDETNRAWAYRDGEDVLERDQAKWEYAVEQRACRLRAEASVLSLVDALHRFLTQHLGMVESLRVVLANTREAYDERQDRAGKPGDA